MQLAERLRQGVPPPETIRVTVLTQPLVLPSAFFAPVDKPHWKRGIPSDCMRCAFALALADRFPGTCWHVGFLRADTGKIWLATETQTGTCFQMSKRAAEAITLWEQTGASSPASYVFTAWGTEAADYTWEPKRHFDPRRTERL